MGSTNFKSNWKRAILINHCWRLIYIKVNLKYQICPYNVSYQDVKNINCSLRRILFVTDIKQNEVAATSVLNEMINIVVKEYDSNNLHISALNLCYLSSDYIPKKFKLTDLDTNLINYYNKNVNISEEKMIQNCIDPVAQCQCRAWFKEKKPRISASDKPHKIKTHCNMQQENIC